VRLLGATLTATDTTFLGNTSGGNGGGVLCLDGGEPFGLTNSTVSGKHGRRDRRRLPRAAPAYRPDARAREQHRRRQHRDGRGPAARISLSGGTATLRQHDPGPVTAVGAAPDCAINAVTSAGYNILGNNTGCTFTSTTGDQVGTGPAPAPIDPLLGVLAVQRRPDADPRTDNWQPGPRRRQPRVAAPTRSAARARDRSSAVSPRPQGTRCDIGAYEALRLGIADHPANEGQAGQQRLQLCCQPLGGGPERLPERDGRLQHRRRRHQPGADGRQ